MKLFIKVAVVLCMLLAPAIRSYAYITMEYGTPRQVAPKNLCYNIDWAMWNDWIDADGNPHHEFIDAGTMQGGKDCNGINGMQKVISNKHFDGDDILRQANAFYAQQVRYHAT